MSVIEAGIGQALQDGHPLSPDQIHAEVIVETSVLPNVQLSGPTRMKAPVISRCALAIRFAGLRSATSPVSQS